MRFRNRVTELLGVEIPIVQAPTQAFVRDPGIVQFVIDQGAEVLS